MSDAESPDLANDAVEAARNICQEARVVLTSLRGGPPVVARGEMAHDLMDVRILVKAHLRAPLSSPVASVPGVVTTRSSTVPVPQSQNLAHNSKVVSSPILPQNDASDEEDNDGAVLVQLQDAQANFVPDSPRPVSKLCNLSLDATPRIKQMNLDGPILRQSLAPGDEGVGPYAHPFLMVIMDPRAAGPHTLVALRSLFRLLEHGSFIQSSPTAKHRFQASFESLMRGVLACKFEQTDAGADEAVEMAIADFLSLLIRLDQRSLQPETLMDAFNTVFVTRNTFVHSPALCYHFEDVLSSMVTSVFGDLDWPTSDAAARLMLEFLVNQLLHTPLTGADAGDASGREAQTAHDATRVLCLRLVRCCLRIGWSQRISGDTVRVESSVIASELSEQVVGHEDDQSDLMEKRSLLGILQDDLCLSLLMTGQAIWAYHNESSNIPPGVISLEVLAEICSTLSTLWNTMALRQHLVSQFETIFTGFYQRALVLLRKRPNPMDSASFNANLVFDAEVELILESLVDILCLHGDSHGNANKGGGALGTLFATYDCHMSRSDVASGLIVELCRSCGGNVNEQGEILFDPTPEVDSRMRTPNTPRSPGSKSTGASQGTMPLLQLRVVPAHLKELCAEGLVGGLDCLVKNDQPSTQDHEEQGLSIPMMGKVGAKNLSMPLNNEGSLGKIPPLPRTTKSQKLLMRRATELFNEKAKGGIQFLVDSNLVANPITPACVASFLRNALVVGINKKAVGQYLGEAGKAPIAGKSPPSWERDWFHKEVLTSYCSLFRFERQSLLDGLRMFLAAFRLPGEAQMIDRILQAFAESCGQVCDEGPQGISNIFSPDPKKAGDAAYLLSFSIIMLNTDRHNDNIREDRKMTSDDFYKNNKDYGEDITEKGHEFPREYLDSIFDSINEEEIRTEGEGVDGHMTVERWKDVLRGPPGVVAEKPIDALSEEGAGDLKSLVLENLWMPIIAAIGALWGAPPLRDSNDEIGRSPRNNLEVAHSGMLGAQGARLGMDMSLEMLNGVRKLGRMDIFRQIFACVCRYSGTLGNYGTDAVDRTWSFANSVEAQSAVIIAIQTARDSGEALDMEGWKCVWGIIFELRDLKLLGGGVSNKARSMLMESEPDLLTMESRRDRTMHLMKVNMDGSELSGGGRRFQKKGFFASIFSPEGTSNQPSNLGPADEAAEKAPCVRTPHGKEESVVWDELAPSDDEDDADSMEANDDQVGHTGNSTEQPFGAFAGSAGTNFESQLIHEDFLIYNQEDTPVTGLERVDDTRQYQISPRARVRKRLEKACDFAGIISDSRFMDIEGLQNLLLALIDIVHSSVPLVQVKDTTSKDTSELHETAETVGKTGNAFSEAMTSLHKFPISPASVAFAEVLICEIAIKNRDRLGILWSTILRDHYLQRLRSTMSDIPKVGSNKVVKPALNPGIEKCVTGLLRVCSCAVFREEIANDVLGSLQLFYPSKQHEPNMAIQGLAKHLAEGLWRICRNVDELRQLGVEGWEGLLGLAQLCAFEGGSAEHVVTGAPGGLEEDDPALRCYRSIHLMLHALELKDVVPFRVVGTIRGLVEAGERGNCPKLSLAALDLLQLLHTRLETLIARAAGEGTSVPSRNSKVEDESEIWMHCWFPVLEGMASPAEHSRYSSVRQHALVMLTDAFIDKQGRSIPADQLCKVLREICFPLAGNQLSEIFKNEIATVDRQEEVMIEFELCISLIFKPFLHHLKRILKADVDLFSVWCCILKIMEHLLGSDNSDHREERKDKNSRDMRASKLILMSKELASEHLRNAITVLIASGVLKGEPKSPNDISAVTWAAVDNMTFCTDETVEEWKQQSAMSPYVEQGEAADIEEQAENAQVEEA